MSHSIRQTHRNADFIVSVRCHVSFPKPVELSLNPSLDLQHQNGVLLQSSLSVYLLVCLCTLLPFGLHVYHVLVCLFIRLSVYVCRGGACLYMLTILQKIEATGVGRHKTLRLQRENIVFSIGNMRNTFKTVSQLVKQTSPRELLHQSKSVKQQLSVSTG